MVSAGLSSQTAQSLSASDGSWRATLLTYVSRDWQDLTVAFLFLFSCSLLPITYYKKNSFASSGVHALVQIENTTRNALENVCDKNLEIFSLSLARSPGILSSKVGQPATNCKRIFLNGFWPRNMSSVTYQKSLKIRGENVDKKQVFFRALYCAAWKRGCMYCLLCCSSLKPRAAFDQQDR